MRLFIDVTVTQALLFARRLAFVNLRSSDVGPGWGRHLH